MALRPAPLLLRSEIGCWQGHSEATGVASQIAWLQAEALILESVWLVSSSGKVRGCSFLHPPSPLPVPDCAVCSCRSGTGAGWRSFPWMASLSPSAQPTWPQGPLLLDISPDPGPWH